MSPELRQFLLMMPCVVQQITACEDFDGSVTLLYKGKSLQYSIFKRGEKIPEPVSEKSINQAVNKALETQSQRTNYKLKPDHLCGNQ